MGHAIISTRRNTFFLSLFSLILTLFMIGFLTGPAVAASDDGGFGENFTDRTPAALSADTGVDFSAESLNAITPASGETVWLPDDTGAAKDGLLTPPNYPLVPGMDAVPDAATETIPAEITNE